MSAHTPGPWKGPSRPYDSVPWLHVYAADGKHIMHADRSDEERLANARLTAAAPEMLAVLQQIASEMDAGFGSSFGETREQVRRAIAKAEGRP